MTARMKGRFSKYLHLIAITSTAVPGVVLGYLMYYCLRKFYLWETSYTNYGKSYTFRCFALFNDV